MTVQNAQEAFDLALQSFEPAMRYELDKLLDQIHEAACRGKFELSLIVDPYYWTSLQEELASRGFQTAFLGPDTRIKWNTNE